MNEELKYWLAVNKIPGLGAVKIKALWQHFKEIKKVWEVTAEELKEVRGLTSKLIDSIIENRYQINLDEEIEKIQKDGLSILTLADREYPRLLKNIYDPPPVLYVKGDQGSFSEKSIAVVGTRKASLYGKTVAENLAKELAALGVTIVSGMALGIDTAAHEGALKAKGRTIAVFGTGIDVVYPNQNKRLAKEIENSGALVSEFPLGTGPDYWTFPQRNRIISGLSQGVIVVEGNFDSGAMITAKLAQDQGREVFAIPGKVELPQSKGPHWLIKQGAKLTESIDDILEELTHVLKIQSAKKTEPRDYSHLPAEEQKIVEVISGGSRHIDDIIGKSELSTPQATSLLMILEVKGLIKQLPGKNFIIVGG